MKAPVVRRREFITLLGGAAAAWPLVAEAQQQGPPVIGWLSSRTAQTDAAVLPAFHRGLNARGYVEGQTVTLEYRWADSQLERLSGFAADLVDRRVAVVIAVGSGTLATQLMQTLSPSTPTIFIVGNDPVQSGLVTSINRPGGNVTGVSAYFQLLGAKRVGLLLELLPRAKAVTLLEDPNADSFLERADVQKAAAALGKELKVLNARSDRELDDAFAQLGQSQTQALLVATSPFYFSRAREIVARAARYVVPTLYFRREFATAGGLMSYGSNADDNYRILGDYAGRILKGAKAGDLPVQQPTKFELVINLQTAKALGLPVPLTLQVAADEVIE